MELLTHSPFRGISGFEAAMSWSHGAFQGPYRSFKPTSYRQIQLQLLACPDINVYSAMLIYRINSGTFSQFDSKYRIVRRIKLKRAGWPTLPKYSGPSPQVQSGYQLFSLGPLSARGCVHLARVPQEANSSSVAPGAVMSCICPASQSDSLKLKLKLKSSLTLLGMFQDSLTGSKDC